MSTASDIDTETPSMFASGADSEVLILDSDTRTDLNLFGSGSGSEANSLFSFCNRCRTEGGTKVLRRRMESPWSSANRIRATQDSLSFILGHRTAFAELPSGYVAKKVERYSSAVLPIIRQHRFLEFTLGAFSLWANDGRFYVKITQGVQFTYRLLAALRLFVRQAQAVSPDGELAPLIEEMQQLLDRPRLSQVLDRETGQWFWQKLRVDQYFRLHEKETIGRLLQLLYEVDALVAMADVTGEHGLVMPCIEKGPIRLNAVGLVHPFVANAVSNPLELNQDRRVLFLTGPNMAGKTTYLRAVATALYFAHLGMGVSAHRFHFVPVQCLLTSISVSDNLNDGISFFRAEALRVKAVAQAVADGHRVISIMDEPFKGTNVKDAFDASLAILRRFAMSEDCLFMVSSHLIELSERLGPALHVDYQYFEAEEQGDQLCFDYVLHPGVSSQRLGMRVLREEGVFDLLDGIVKRE
jgi:DNA mismatch repair protein MutS